MRRLLYLALGLMPWSQLSADPSIAWQGPPFFISTRGMSVAQLIADLGANYGVPVIVSPHVTDLFVGRFLDKSPEPILEELSSLYRLIWYFDGTTLHVYKSSEIEQVVITPSYLTAETFESYLKQSGLLDSKSGSITRIPGFNAFEVSGPPAFVKRVQGLIEDLDKHSENLSKNRETIEMFPLKYASADDHTYRYRNQELTIPGVVTLLKQIQAGGGGEESNPVSELIREATFIPDLRNNSVIVRDKEINMPVYQNLIEKLDEVPKQIELSVIIVDVDAEDSRKLGLNSNLTGSNSNEGETSLTGNYNQQLNEAGKANSLGFSGTISKYFNFEVTLNALQQQSKAKVLAEPSIVTVNHVQAVLDKTVTLYTKLNSKENPKMESVQTGTLLEVTPHIVRQEAATGPYQTQMGGEAVMLYIHLQDGKMDDTALTSESDDTLPKIQNSEIFTQALLRPDEGILLGGFVREEEFETQYSVPMLGSLPFIGQLFSQTAVKKEKLVRLFFIRATPIDLLQQRGVQLENTLQTNPGTQEAIKWLQTGSSEGNDRPKP